MSQLRESLLLALVAVGDRVVPKHREVVLRTGPDFNDQGREILAALGRAGFENVTWLVTGSGDPGRSGPVGCRVVSARSIEGIRAFWRARVVVHTHGIYGSRSMSKRKKFVNVWHGMPIKRLEQGSAVGRHQTDLTIATSEVHARNLASTWGLAPDHVAITGLPRNDVLMRPPSPETARALEEVSNGQRLVVWLPTYRSQADQPGADGVDTGTVTQFAGAVPAAVDAMAGRLGLKIVVKAHPLAPVPQAASLAHLEIWSDGDMHAHGLTLYNLLTGADVVISDHSSVWVDFLLTQRPVVFAVSDLAEYTQTRGFYFDDVAALLPGPLVNDVDELEVALAEALGEGDQWAPQRLAARATHHVHCDDRSADRVALLILSLLDGS